MKKKYRLPRQFAEKWLEALRSGDYSQGAENLKTELDEGIVEGETCQYCCIGVACEILNLDEHFSNELIGSPFVSDDYLSTLAIEDLLEKGFPEELMGEYSLANLLAALNDGNFSGRIYLEDYKFRDGAEEKEFIQLSFSQIADFIEDNVEFYDT